MTTIEVKPENLYIEGDNLEVLKILKRAYAEKIKMIYIDPPYNIGKNFVYKDDYTDNLKNYLEQTGQLTADGKAKSSNTASDGRFHTNWLNMMYPRLRLARELLSDDGVIFISIDDNEVANLKKICDEVFGEINFVAQLIWSLGTGTQAGHFVRSHEYIIVYFKDKSIVSNFSGGSGIIEHSALKKISQKNPASNFVFKAGTRWDATDNTELKGIWGGSESTTLIKGRMICKNGKLLEDVVLSAGWAMKSQMQSYFNGLQTFDSKGQILKSFYFNKSGILRYEKERSVVNPPTILKDIASTKNGTDELNALFDDELFDFPKSSMLIKYIISLVSSKDSIILDFFSGSGTTAHSVMQLNAEDGENRKFIMVQLPEPCKEDSQAYKANYKSIAEIGNARIDKAGDKIIEDAKKAGKDVSNLDVGFKVFKLSKSNM